MKRNEIDLISGLLSWFGSIDDPNIQREMAAVVATKLCIGFLVMPVEPAKPSADLYIKMDTQISRSDAATLSAIRNLRGLLLLAPQAARSGIRQLALSAIIKMREDDFFEAVFLPSQALKKAGDFHHAVTRLQELEHHQLEVVEMALPERCQRSLADVRTGSTMTNYEAIETVASMALTMAASILIDTTPRS